MGLKEIDVNTRNWIDSAQDRDYQRALVNAELNLLYYYYYCYYYYYYYYYHYYYIITDHEVAGSIPGTSANFKCGLDLERGPPSLVRTIGQLLDWEVADLIKKVDIIRLDGA